MKYRLVGRIEERDIELPLTLGSLVLGSGRGADLRVADPTVSRLHARLEVHPDRVEVTDLGSKNGTFVDRRRVETASLPGQGEIVFGRVRLTLVPVSLGDDELGLVFDPDDPSSEVRDTGMETVDATPFQDFVREQLPPLIRHQLERPGPIETAQRAGTALIDSLPLLRVEIRDRSDGEDVHLYHGAREGTEREKPLQAESSGLSVTVRPAAPFPPSLIEPLLDAVLSLLLLSSGRPPEPPPATTGPPPLPEPASLDPEMLRIYREAVQVARSMVGVLITGESGTGKEVLARFLHRASPRAEQSFVAINCAALPRDLLEAELFGIEKGVATGVDPRPGKFEQADGGTLFLDEIGDMPLETQAMILRVLQEREVLRIGATRPRQADVRVLAATNRDVDTLIDERRFREDLYFRIATWVVHLPPLRQRRIDLPNLTAHFAAREAARQGKRIRGVTRAALERIERYDWPGNVRQLQQEVAKAVAFARDGAAIDSSLLSPTVLAGPGDVSERPLDERLEHYERLQIVQALQRCNWDVPAAAELLAVPRSTLYRRMKKLGLDPRGPGGAPTEVEVEA